MAWIDELTELLPPPAPSQAVETIDWSSQEDALGVEVPEDFKVFVATYGAKGGALGDFIQILSPVTSKRSVQLARAAVRENDAYATLKAHHPHAFPLQILPEPGSFLPWAVTDNGDYLGWIVGDGPSSDWPVAVLDDESGVPEVFEISFGDFMVGLVKGEITPSAFPGNLYMKPMRFEGRAE